MSLPLMLPVKPPEHPAMDYAFLRQEGIRHLERLAGNAWTDFNAHDPGITILEQICYAITDLAYRINYDLREILTSQGEDAYRSLHTPAQVLTIHPVTLTDLRKLALDVPGVKNAWFEPVKETQPGLIYDVSEEVLCLEKEGTSRLAQHEPVPIQGLYRVLLEIDRNSTLASLSIPAMVDSRLRADRLLCQDFLYPTVLDGQGIVVQADIEVGAVDNPERLLAEIYTALAGFISPDVHFQTLNEMLARGKRIDEIMNGPRLRHGFIDDAELEKLERKAGLRASDLIQVILNVEGTSAIGDITILGSSHPEAWYLKLDPQRTPFLDIEKSLFAGEQESAIRLTRRGIPVQVDPGRVRSEILKRLRQRAPQELLPEQLDIYLAPGRDRKISQYYSIQHQFPAVYGIGDMGLPDSASSQRKAQAKQLKAYLMFFDQLLANYFAQLANAKELFSFYAPQPCTYFSQIVETAGLEEIRAPGLTAEKIQQLTEVSTLETTDVKSGVPVSFDRKNRFLNHLLARFAEPFSDYSLLHFADLQGQGLTEEEKQAIRDAKERTLLEAKSLFLRDYRWIGPARGCGFDYTRPLSDTDNLSGLKKRISLKLGISSGDRMDLASSGSEEAEGFHLLEHLLLRPSRADEEQIGRTGWQASAFMKQPSRRDPYSRQVSFVFPKWVRRFTEPGFSRLIEKTVREETPAHLQVHLHWLDSAQMLAFESAYRDWLTNMIAAQWWNAGETKPADDRYMARIRMRAARDRIVWILGIGTPYPLRDLKLEYPEMVPYEETAQVRIVGGQTGVSYQLCDDEGNLVSGNREVQPAADTANGAVFLVTPPVKKDVTYTVLATRSFQIVVRGGELIVNGNKHAVRDPEQIMGNVAIKRLEPPTGSAEILVDGRRIILDEREILVRGRGMVARAEIAVEGRETVLDGAQAILRGSEILVDSAETYLNQTVSVKAGIDTSLHVELIPSPSQISDGNRIAVRYGDRIEGKVAETQEGLSYKLVIRTKPGETRDCFLDISDEQIGNRKAILLSSTQPFCEDTQVNILAYRTLNPNTFAILQTVLEVRVRPDPAVTFQAETPIADYGAGSILHLLNPQASAEYKLYRRELVRTDYLPSGTAGSLALPIPANELGDAEKDRTLSIAAPEKIRDWDALSGFMLAGTFQNAGKGNLSFDVRDLLDDTLFIVRAVKKQTGEEVQLDQAVVVLVRPDTTRKILVKKDLPGRVEIERTQKGVAYQLLLNDRPVNPPGYRAKHRGVGTVGVEVDLIVGSPEGDLLSLPTGPVGKKATKVSVRASKILTGISTLLTDTSTISSRSE